MVSRTYHGLSGRCTDPYGGPTRAVDSLSPPTRFVSLRSHFTPLRAPHLRRGRLYGSLEARDVVLTNRLCSQCATLSGSRATLPAVSRAHRALTTSWSGTQSSLAQVSDYVISSRRTRRTVCGSQAGLEETVRDRDGSGGCPENFVSSRARDRRHLAGWDLHACCVRLCMAGQTLVQACMPAAPKRDSKR